MRPDKLQLLVEKRWPDTPVASTRELVAAGLDERVLTAAVRSGVILRLRRGAYVRNAYWIGVKPWARDRLRIDAHFESTGGLSSYSHVSAARLHGCQTWRAGPLVHVTTGYSNSRKSAGNDVRTHRAALDAGEVTTLLTNDGREMRVTTLERTVLDCARILPLAQAAVIGDHALRKGASLEALRAMLERSPVKRGSRRAADLLEILDARSESAGETRTRLLLQSFGLRTFIPQLAIDARGGSYRADFADPVRKAVIEFDGATKYFDYRPTGEVLVAERRRENALREEGWAVLRLEWSHLDRPAELRRRLAAFLARESGTQKRPRPA